ncbi:MAG: hypothetical protein LBP52_09985, partial [Burkholderiaceae bacterium]|nr:hypothetical protein [Burkholderiaceae bacterium]
NTDTNGFDYKRYPNPPVVGTEGTKGKIAKIVLNAIRPGGFAVRHDLARVSQPARLNGPLFGVRSD